MFLIFVTVLVLCFSLLKLLRRLKLSDGTYFAWAMPTFFTGCAVFIYFMLYNIVNASSGTAVFFNVLLLAGWALYVSYRHKKIIGKKT